MNTPCGVPRIAAIPKSPMLDTATSNAAEVMLGNINGRVMRRIVVNTLAPAICELSSSEASIDRNEAEANRYT